MAATDRKKNGNAILKVLNNRNAVHKSLSITLKDLEDTLQLREVDIKQASLQLIESNYIEISRNTPASSDHVLEFLRRPENWKEEAIQNGSNTSIYLNSYGIDYIASTLDLVEQAGLDLALSAYQDIKELLDQAKFPEKIVRTCIYDLKESEKCYKAGAHKACVVMLGAFIEGVMIGFVSDEYLQAFIRNERDKNPNSYGSFKKYFEALDNSQTKEESKQLSFENLVQKLKDLIGGDDAKDIQYYRNAIHPRKVWNREYELAEFEEVTALSRLSSVKKITRRVVQKLEEVRPNEKEN